MFAPYLVCAVLASTGDVQLLHFSAPWCRACESSKPAVQRIETEGLKVHHINVDEHPDLARKFSVKTVPAFIVLVGNRPAGRIDQGVDYNRLAQLVRDAQPIARGQSPTNRPNAERGIAGQNSVDRNSRSNNSRSNNSRSNNSRSNNSRSNERHPDAAHIALAATVRMRIEDEHGQSYGTGTIIDAHNGEALVLTCGHVFRDSQGKGKIQIDIFDRGREASAEPMLGKLLRYDLKNDLALVSFRPGFPVKPVRVASSMESQRGSPVFSVGCNRGAAPSVMQGRVNAINKYVGPPANIVVSGQPIDGRSGGGLFSADGELIGVCQAADPEYNEGLYGHLPAVHQYLDQARLSFVYQGQRPMLADNDRSETNNRITGQTARGSRPNENPLPDIRQDRQVAAGNFQDRGRNQSRDSNQQRESNERRGSNPSPLDQNQLDILAKDERVEVVCIVRSKEDPSAGSKIVVLDRPSREFIQQLSRERQQQKDRTLTGLRVIQEPSTPFRSK